MFVTRSLYLLTVLVMVSGVALAELRVPAFTGYIDPDPSGARVSETYAVLVCWLALFDSFAYVLEKRIEQ